MATQIRTLAHAALLAGVIFTDLSAFAQTAPSLGGSANFAVLAGSTVTNTGSTTVAGDVGVSPGTAITGFPPGMLTTGTLHAADAIANQAQADATTAYNVLAGQACNTDLTGTDLGGLTLTAGVYCFSTSAQLTGTLTLNAQGNSNAVFIFQIGSTLTTASAANVVVINGGSDCNIFWQVGSSATLGTGTSFVGNILAQASITLTTGASLAGHALASTGAVTLASNALAICGEGCSVITIGPATLPAATVGVPYSHRLTATGDSGTFLFSVASGALPAGLSLSPNGVISGTPTSPGVATFLIDATPPDGCGSTLPLTITVGTAVGGFTPTPIPSLSLRGLFVLMLALTIAAATRFLVKQR